jgi:hypothetical protein
MAARETELATETSIPTTARRVLMGRAFGGEFI